jgi:hypothetical protein
MKKHKHHIIPKHMGGSDDPSNLVELTIEEHAEAHRLLYETYGHTQDKVAWLGLVGIMPHGEIIYTLLSEGKKGNKNPMFGKPSPNRGIKRPGVGGRKKGTKWSAEERATKEKMRSTTEYKEKMAAVYSDPIRNANISKNSKGKIGAATGKAWYNNGVEEKYFVVDQQPKGFARGRLTGK